MNMSEYPEFSDREQTRESAMKRFGKRITERLFPYKITRYNSESFSVPLNNIIDEADSLYFSDEMPSSVPTPEQGTILITLSADKHTVHFTDETGKEAHPSFTSKKSLEANYTKFANLYINTPTAEVNPETTDLYTERTARGVLQRWDTIIPDSLMITYEKDNAICATFGNIALASALDIESHPLAHSIDNPIKRKEAIDQDKEDLTTKDHAIIIRNQGEKSFHIELDDKRSILALRVIETIVNSASSPLTDNEIAAQSWISMTVEERSLFTKSKNKPYEDTIPNETFVKEVLRILRGLTNKLMLTHEQYTNKFNVLNRDVDIRYSDEPLLDEQIEQHAALHTIYGPGSVDMKALTQTEREQLVQTAKKYVSYIRSQADIKAETAIDILDFIMSKEGKWALRSISGTDEGYPRPNTAVFMAHKYVRSKLKNAYRSAHRERLISGNTSIKQKGSVRHVSGRLPGSSNWTLGRSWTETNSSQHKK